MLPRPCVSGNGDVANCTMEREREEALLPFPPPLPLLPLLGPRDASMPLGMDTVGGGALAMTEAGRVEPPPPPLEPLEPGQGFMALLSPRVSTGEVGRVLPPPEVEGGAAPVEAGCPSKPPPASTTGAAAGAASRGESLAEVMEMPEVLQ